ncbi:unnamed protein product [Parajaminaea phylloscopi]
MAPKRKASPAIKAEEPSSKAVKAEASEAVGGPWRFSPSQPISDNDDWPAPAADMRAATAFLRRLLPTAHDGPSSSKDTAIVLSQEHPLVLLPDKDADGLCSTLILHRTLLHLGVSPEHIHIHHLQKANHTASSSETAAIKALQPSAVIVLDQGSRPGPPLLGAGDKTPVLVIDHHFLKPGETGPKGSLMVNACHSLPVATSSLLSWCLCRPLWSPKAEQEAEDQIDWLAVLGTAGDLSINVAWDPPWPDLSGQFKKWTKKRMSTAIALLNAPRRTPEFDVSIAYASLRDATTPVELVDPKHNANAARLYAAREAVAAESERCTHTPPKFSKDGRVAVLFISSQYQVHPGIATRWSGALRGAKKLQVVMAANTGYSPAGTHTHFSCRRAQVSLKRGENPNIIALLHEYAARDPTFLDDVAKAESEHAADTTTDDAQGIKQEDAESAGPLAPTEEAKGALNFARGHKEASGGILPHALFQRFTELMQVGVPPDKEDGPHEERGGGANKAKKGKAGPEQKTKLTSFFATASPTKAR